MLRIDAIAWNEDRNGKHFEIETFEDIEEAREWLKSHDTDNKILAVGTKAIIQTHDYLWNSTSEAKPK